MWIEKKIRLSQPAPGILKKVSVPVCTTKKVHKCYRREDQGRDAPTLSQKQPKMVVG
jgi:hypothetical protein